MDIEKKDQITNVRKIKPRQKSSVKSKTRPSRNKADKGFDDGDENSYFTSRVSHKEELQLAHIIQRGVELNNIKTKFKKKKKRDIMRQEWTDLAKLGSPVGLVHTLVRRRLNRSGNTSYKELGQEGSLGLLRAAESFSKKGYKIQYICHNMD